jgi:predicted DNA-binding helix-hairpin-helix protein
MPSREAAVDVLSLDRKIEILMSLAADDREASPSLSPDLKKLPPRLRNANEAGALRPLNLRTVSMGRGGRTTLLRILMTNACSYNCHYCPMRRDRNMPRALLKPEELVKIFLAARDRGWCEGLFITTGIPGRAVKVMDDLIQALEILRYRHRFAGYIHVKILAGAEPAQVERITQLATRISVNLEAPCGETLTPIAPEKSFDTTMATLERARTLVQIERRQRADGKPADNFHPGGVAGMTTQFVVGATPDSDRAIVSRVGELYAKGGVHHVHFSAFRPISETPLESRAATPAIREHRLYQTDYLLRYYGFTMSDVVYADDGNLPLNMDPKVAWALAQPNRFMVELTTASRELLLRVPGIGPTAAKRVVEARRSTVIRGLDDLKKLGVQTTRASGFLTLKGRAFQSTRWTEQLGFWNVGEEVGAPKQLYAFSPGTFR